MVHEDLAGVTRVLFEATLKPVQGFRFQPTGFPQLGAATYQTPDRRQMLLVESPQSMANRLEAVCWDFAKDELAEPLAGLPYVRVELPDGRTTNSILEAHRLNSPYIMKRKGDGIDEAWLQTTFPELATAMKNPFDERGLASAVFRYDTNSVLHGVFLEKLAGGLRLVRVLSAFIEAEDVQPADSGGVKKDIVDPTGKKWFAEGAQLGFGHVPFHRREFTAGKVTAYFNLDLVQLRDYGLGAEREHLLTTLALWKARKLLSTRLRLRTACDLDVMDVRVTEPKGWELPDLKTLEKELPTAIAACKPFMSGVQRLEWKPLPKSSEPKSHPKEEAEGEGEDEEKT